MCYLLKIDTRPNLLELQVVALSKISISEFIIVSSIFHTPEESLDSIVGLVVRMEDTLLSSPRNKE